MYLQKMDKNTLEHLKFAFVFDIIIFLVEVLRLNTLKVLG